MEEFGGDAVSDGAPDDSRGRRFWRAVISVIVLDFALFGLFGELPSYRDALNDVVVGPVYGDVVLYCRQTSGWTPSRALDGVLGWRGSTLAGFWIEWSWGAANTAGYFYLSIPLELLKMDF